MTTRETSGAVGVALGAITFVVGLGFAFTGYQSEGVGWALVLVGLVSAIVIGAWWLWPRFAVAAVRTAAQHGASIPQGTASDPAVIKATAEGTARLERMRQEDWAHRREIREALQTLIGELDYNRKFIEKSDREGRWWDPDKRWLVASVWTARFQLLAGEGKLVNAYRLAENAYQEIDRLNHLARDRHDEEYLAARAEIQGLDVPIIMEPPSIGDEDEARIREALEALNAARQELERAVLDLGQ